MQPHIIRASSHSKFFEPDLSPVVNDGHQSVKDGTSSKISSEIKPVAAPAVATTFNIPLVSVNPSSSSSVKVDALASKKLGLWDWCVATVVTQTIKFVVGDKDLSKVNEESKARISKLTENLEPGLTLEAVASKFGEVVLSAINDKLNENSYGLGIQQAFLEEQQLITDCLHATLLRMAANLATQAKNENRINPDEFIGFPDLVARLLELSGNYLVNLHHLTDDDVILDTKEQASKMQAHIESFKNDLLHLLLPNGAEDIVIPGGWFVKKGKEKIYGMLSDFLASVYNDIASWIIDERYNKQKIMKIYTKYKPSVPLAAAQVVTRFASDYIRVLLNNPVNKVATVNFTLKYEDGAIKAYIKDKPTPINKWVQANLRYLMDKNLGFADIVIPAAEKYIEAGILKAMTNIFANKEQKGHDPKFLVNLGLKMINVANEHFTEIIRIMGIYNVDLASKVDPNRMAAEYKNFHEALDPKVTESHEKEALIKDKFYIPFTEQLLRLAGVTSDNLPVPAALRQKLFELVKTELGPEMIKAMLDAIDVDQIMLKVLEAVNAEKEPKKAAEFDDDIVLTKEEMNEQVEIDKACGDLFLNLVRLLPNKMIRAFFFNEKIKKLSAQTLGKLLREQLGSMNLLKVVNDALAQGVSSLNERITVDKEGNLVVPDDLHFVFPTNLAESEARDALKAQEKIDMNERLIKELAKIIGYQIKSRIENFFTAPWKRFQEKLDAWIQEKIGSGALEIKRKLEKFFHALVFSTIAALLYVLFIPFTLILRKIFRKKAKEIVSLIHMDIHKNLVFKMADIFME